MVKGSELSTSFLSPLPLNLIPYPFCPLPSRPSKPLVRDRLDAGLAYTTVLTILRHLEGKGLVRREAQGRAHRYFPRIAQRIAQRSALHRVLDGFFGGSPEALLTRLVDDHGVDANELRAMAKRISKSSTSKRRSQ